MPNDGTDKSSKEPISGNTAPSSQVSEAQMQTGKMSLIFYLIPHWQIQTDVFLCTPLSQSGISLEVYYLGCSYFT